MNVTVLACFNRRSLRFSLYHPAHYALLLVIGVVVVTGTGVVGYRLGHAEGTTVARADWQTELRAQEEQMNQLRMEKRAEISALSQRVADLSGRLTELDALGRTLANAADVDLGELEFAETGGLGGPLVDFGDTDLGGDGASEVRANAERLDNRIDNRERMLSVVEGFLVEQELKTETTPAGWPIDGGWISSSYGHRTDPFTGEQAFHAGADFATHEGKPVLAIAGGVVTYSGHRSGYGNMVEINHGNGYTTRYGHNKENTVSEGEVVRAGAEVARVGNTGRSTGPHVHLEVREDGEPKNPAPYASAER